MRPPQEVFEDHLRLAKEGDVDEDLRRNYSSDVKVLMADGVYSGHDQVKGLADRLQRELPEPRFRYTTTWVVDEIAYLEWTGEGGGNRVRDGADTFWIREGKVRVQTIHYTVESNDGRPLTTPP